MEGADFKNDTAMSESEGQRSSVDRYTTNAKSLWK
jgi:hypothetical protein